MNDLEDFDAFGMSHGRAKAAISPSSQTGSDEASEDSSGRSKNGPTKEDDRRRNAASGDDSREHVDNEYEDDHDDMSSVTSATSNASTISSSHYSKYSKDSYYAKKPVIRLEMALDEKDDIEEQSEEERSYERGIRRTFTGDSTLRAKGEQRSLKSGHRSQGSRRRSRSRGHDSDEDHPPIPRTVSSRSSASGSTPPRAKKGKSKSKRPRINPHRLNEVVVRNEMKSWLHLLVEVNYEAEQRPYRHNQISPDEHTDGNLHAYYGSDEDPSMNEEGKQSEIDEQLGLLLNLLRDVNKKHNDVDDHFDYREKKKRGNLKVDTRDDGKGRSDEDRSPTSPKSRASYDSDLSSHYLKPLPTLSDINASPNMEAALSQNGRQSFDDLGTSRATETRSRRSSSRTSDLNSTDTKSRSEGLQSVGSTELKVYPSVDSSGTDLSGMYKDSLTWSKSSTSGTSPVNIAQGGSGEREGSAKENDDSAQHCFSSSENASIKSTKPSDVKKVFSFYDKGEVENAPLAHGNEHEPSTVNSIDETEEEKSKERISVTSPMSSRQNDISNMLDAFDTDIEESTKKVAAGYRSCTSHQESDDESKKTKSSVARRLLALSKSASGSTDEDEKNAPLAPNNTVDTPDKKTKASPEREKPKASRSILETVLGRQQDGSRGGRSRGQSVDNFVPPRSSKDKDNVYQSDKEYEGDESDETKSGKSQKSLRSAKAIRNSLSRKSAEQQRKIANKAQSTPKASRGRSFSDFAGATGTTAHGPVPMPIYDTTSTVIGDAPSAPNPGTAATLVPLSKPERLEDSDEEGSMRSVDSGSHADSKKSKISGGALGNLGRRARSRSVSRSRARSSSRSSSQNPKKRWTSFVTGTSGAASGTEADASSTPKTRHKSLIPPLPLVKQNSKVKGGNNDNKEESLLLSANTGSFDNDKSNDWKLDPLAPPRTNDSVNVRPPIGSPSKHPNKENKARAKGQDAGELVEDNGSIKATVFSPGRDGKDKENKDGKSVLGEITKSITPFRKKSLLGSKSGNKHEALEKTKKKEAKLLSSSSYGQEDDDNQALTQSQQGHPLASNGWEELDVPHDELASTKPYQSSGAVGSSRARYGSTSNNESSLKAKTSARPSKSTKKKPAPTLIDSDGFLLECTAAGVPGSGNEANSSTPDANAFNATFGISEDDFWGGILPDDFAGGWDEGTAKGNSAALSSKSSTEKKSKRGPKVPLSVHTDNSKDPVDAEDDQASTGLQSTKSMDDNFYEKEEAMRKRAKALLDTKLGGESARIMSPSALMEMQFDESSDHSATSRNTSGTGRNKVSKRKSGSRKQSSPRNDKALNLAESKKSLDDAFAAGVSPTLSTNKSVGSKGSQSLQRRRERNQILASERRTQNNEATDETVNVHSLTITSKSSDKLAAAAQPSSGYLSDEKSVDSMRSGKSGKSSKSSRPRRDKLRNNRRDPSLYDTFREKPVAVDVSDTKSVDSMKSGKSGRSTKSDMRRMRKEAKKVLKQQLQQKEEAQRVDAVEAATKRRIESLRKMIAEAGNDATTESLQQQLDLIERETLKKLGKVKEKNKGSKPVVSSTNAKMSDRSRDSRRSTRRSTRTHNYAAERFQPLDDEDHDSI